jgi:DNA-binding NarL/FixJ family response regulator
MIRVFLCETESAPDTLETTLGALTAIDLVGTSHDPTLACAKVRGTRPAPDVLLLCCAALGRVEAALIDAVYPVPTLVVCPRHSEASDMLALRTEVRGYITDVSPTPEELAEAVTLIASGYAVFSGNRAQDMRWSNTYPNGSYASFPDLTGREREVLGLVALGLSNNQIAGKLVIEEKTVRNHLTNIYSKLEVSNRAGAIIKAHEAGLGR